MWAMLSTAGAVIMVQLVTPTQCVLQGVEIRAALIVQHHGLTVQDDGRDMEIIDGRFEGGKPFGPVLAVSGQYAGRCRTLMKRQPISIPFYFKGPLFADWRLRCQFGEAQFDAFGLRIERELWLVRIAQPSSLAANSGVWLLLEPNNFWRLSFMSCHARLKQRDYDNRLTSQRVKNLPANSNSNMSLMPKRALNSLSQVTMGN